MRCKLTSDERLADLWIRLLFSDPLQPEQLGMGISSAERYFLKLGDSYVINQPNGETPIYLMNIIVVKFKPVGST